MKYRIGDIVQDPEGYTGIVCIDWNIDYNDKSPSCMEKEATHSGYGKIGHWPKDSIVGAAERERRLGTLKNKSRK